MVKKELSTEELLDMMGEDMFQLWSDVNRFIDKNYDTKIYWDRNEKKGEYELKYRRGGRTLCSLYPKGEGLVILIIFGQKVREKFESARQDFSKTANVLYDLARQYHDGKWLYFDLTDFEAVEDAKKMLLIKRKPKKKRA